MKKIVTLIIFLYLSVFQLRAQSVLGLENRWSKANLDTIIQHVSTGLGVGYGIADYQVSWMIQATTPYFRADIQLQKGYGIDRSVRRDHSKAINVTILGHLTPQSDTVITSTNIEGRWDDIKNVFFTLYKPAESPDNIVNNGKSQKLTLITQNKKLDEVVYCDKVDPDETWSLHCLLALHPNPWKPEMAAIYGSEREKAVEEYAARQTTNPFFSLIETFKVIYAENIRLYLLNEMKCTQVSKTVTLTDEQFVFARNSVAQDPQNITLNIMTNSNKRVVSVKIIGSVSAMKELYKGFWDIYNDSTYIHAIGVVDGKTVLGDVVTYKVSGAEGYITITKRPGFVNSDLEVPKIH